MIGQTISHYKILEKLGEGGMGVVYKAEDTRLDRMVALKFLPPSLATQDAAKKRFIHEAKAASSLEHPNICAVYDIDETPDGRMFIVMPYYEGETLQEKIANGPVEVGEVIDIVVQMASGLAKAHEKGIVHRDIKPGNIFLTKDGHVKILDFGLAKLATETRLTKSGMTLGTIAYMSPEQASGSDVDARSDIFSLGAVFYELLTGALPFKGDHEAAIIYGIIHSNPEPLGTCRSDIPEGLQQITDMALNKQVSERYQTTLELKDALGELGWSDGTQSRVPSRSTGAVTRSPLRRAVPWIVLGGAVLAVALFFMKDAIRSPSRDPSRSVSATYTQLTFTGDAQDPIISPDGQFVAYWRETENHKQILVRDIGGGAPVVVFEGFDTLYSLRWSPDGSRLLAAMFKADGERHIYIVPRLGGSVRRIDYFPYVAWSPDGLRLAAAWMPSKKISFIDVSTGTVESDALTLEVPYTWLHDLDWSPDGDRLLVHVSPKDGGEEIWTVDVDGRDPTRVASERKIASPRWAPLGGSIYYVVPKGAIQSLWRVGVDPQSGRITEKPVVILSGMAGLGRLSFTSDGKLLAYARHVVDRDLWLFSTDKNEGDGEPISKQLTSGTAIDDGPSVSPDGREVAFVRVTGEASNVFVVSIEGNAARQVTFMNSECYSPVWSPDGKEIALAAYENGEYKLWRASVEGGAAEVFENTHAHEGARLAWAPGEKILYTTPNGRNFMVLDPVSGDERPLIADESVGWVSPMVVAPDKTHGALFWNQSKRHVHGIWIISLVDSSHALVLEGHRDPFGWSPDGKWIYYYTVPKIGRVRPDGKGDEVLRLFPFENVKEHPFVTMSPDAKSVVGGFEVKTPSDIWLIENFDPDVQ